MQTFPKPLPLDPSPWTPPPGWWSIINSIISLNRPAYAPPSLMSPTFKVKLALTWPWNLLKVLSPIPPGKVIYLRHLLCCKPYVCNLYLARCRGLPHAVMVTRKTKTENLDSHPLPPPTRLEKSTARPLDSILNVLLQSVEYSIYKNLTVLLEVLNIQQIDHICSRATMFMPSGEEDILTMMYIWISRYILSCRKKSSWDIISVHCAYFVRN